MIRKRVLLTGATGNWGRAVLAEFARRADRFEVVALVLPGDRQRAVLRRYRDVVRVAEGDLTDYRTVEAAVRGADYVVHLGAVVSPLADDLPELTHRVNVGGTRNLVRAIRAQPDPDAIGLVAAGSVAETGDRNPPVHWGRVGDPLRVSRYDEYGQSKVAAEREVVDSGLNRWVWLRQTGIFHPGLLKVRDPIITHTPLGGVMEWVSAEDSARLVAGICEAGAPPEVWGGVYNIGGGEAWRLTNWEFLVRLMGALGVADVRRWYERRWFATRNFHGHWFTDSDRLDQLVPFRQDTFAEALARAVPPIGRLAGKVPPWLVKKFLLGPLTRHPRGTMAWLRDNDTERLDAYFGADVVGDWTDFAEPSPSRTPAHLDHGYDEDLDPAQWTVRDLAKAAAFRGGELLSENLVPGDVRTPLRWRCAFGHTFPGSPRLILRAGHWCPECVRNPADYAHQAERNAFLAQVIR
ncbi:nucleoside-diphosphate-sugar epimerase [Amycolatopsis bartoniae]|nr:NAD(P)-dependent oxidoreductase [Amycolatopsis bartoniae]MBB2936809.1 nucleoside-diphosphate-sugar epimerase [Amycolatopsis bartoniae]TVT09147.1 NAD(P)-dependent oxidoreductase [Amycolatopsis bartoniae]